MKVQVPCTLSSIFKINVMLSHLGIVLGTEVKYLSQSHRPVSFLWVNWYSNAMEDDDW